MPRGPGLDPDSDVQVPPVVGAARSRAAAAGFGLSSEDGVGRLLAVLAAAVPPAGRVLELGTGAGVGLVWMQRLDLSLAALRHGGTLLVDDLWPRSAATPAELADRNALRRAVAGHPDLASVELEWSSGVLLAVRRRR